MKTTLILKNSIFCAIAAIGLFSCTPDEVENGNPLAQSDLDADFVLTSTTDTIVARANAQNLVFTATSDDPAIQYHTWRASGANGVYGSPNVVKGTKTHKFTFNASGTYKIEHRVVGRVGGTNFVSEHQFTVTLPEAPTGSLGPNLIASPNFENPANWTVLRINQTGTAHWAFADGKATISGATGHEGIYQAVTVEANESYKFDMRVQGPGSTNTWFEVYVSPTAPTPNSDYSAGGKRLQLNTWAGCATSPFDGLLSQVGCGNAEVSGNVVTFTESGTVYFLIKSGESGGNINSISVSNVVFQKIN
jgi:hypothetical protein